MVDEIARILQSAPVVILDGALATELERRGCNLNDPLWSAKILLEQPEIIRQVHADYFEAGADCAITASYQATFAGFAQRGLTADESAHLMQLSVQLALQARDSFWVKAPHHRQRPFVAASIGPYGAYLHDGSEYHGNYDLSLQDLMDFHRPRMAVLIEAGAEMLACETIPSLLEAQALARLLTEFPGVSAWMSFSARDNTHISHGETLAEAAALLDTHPQITAIGNNCTPPPYITELVRSASAATSKPILTYPNSGESYDAVMKTWRGISSCEVFSDHAREWFEAGARVIGGCCRTTPDHIRQLATTLRN